MIKFLKNIFGDKFSIPENEERCQKFLDYVFTYKDILENVEVSIEKSVITNYAFNNNLKLTSFETLFNKRFKNIQILNQRLKKIEGEEIEGGDILCFVGDNDINEYLFVDFRNIKVIASTNVQRYSSLLDENVCQRLEEAGFLYLPLYDTLYNEEEKIFIYSIDKFYGYLDNAHFGYFEIIQQKYNQNIVLSEITSEGLPGFSLAVPMKYFGRKDENSSEREILANYIANFYSKEIEETNESISHYDFNLNQKLEFDWEFRASYLDFAFDVTGVISEDFYKYDGIEYLGGNSLKLSYNHISAEEKSLSSADELSKTQVTNIELYGVLNFINSKLVNGKIQALPKNQYSNQEILKAKNKISICGMKFDESQIKEHQQVIDLVDAVRYSRKEDNLSSNLEETISLIDRLLNEGKAIYLTNKMNFKNKERFIKLDKKGSKRSRK